MPTMSRGMGCVPAAAIPLQEKRMNAVRCLRCDRTFVPGTAYLHPTHRCATTNPTLPRDGGGGRVQPDDCPPAGLVIPFPTGSRRTR